MGSVHIAVIASKQGGKTFHSKLLWSGRRGGSNPVHGRLR